MSWDNRKTIPVIDLISNSSSGVISSAELNGTNESNDGIFQFQDCQNDTCEFYNMSCASCKAKYKYWDESIWIKCGRCKKK